MVTYTRSAAAAAQRQNANGGIGGFIADRVDAGVGGHIQRPHGQAARTQREDTRGDRAIKDRIIGGGGRRAQTPVARRQKTSGRGADIDIRGVGRRRIRRREQHRGKGQKRRQETKHGAQG